MGLDGDIVADGYCGRRPTEKFWIEPVTKPVRGFRMRPVGSRSCLGVADKKEWTIVRLVDCDSTANQVFRFESR